ncbi:carboxypeptidase family protein [Edaphobacter aggregans]|uniref:Carboxypeptidase family protein n=1 Tax=Edaphobacter aggregans TaxID=570835 RepID=A0A428MI21_9BACT|nr:TonB-dependent receptor [Edaphobacter aggregans]RSL16507.1 carboxypeptidase family protein [Edaphobacter aggregans]
MWLLMFVWGAMPIPNAFCQSTFGSIRGVVQDSSGAVVPGAAVTIHSLDENVDRQVTTGDAGEFVAENLKPGHYQLTIRHDGFADAVVNSASLETRQDLRIPITLAIASAKPTVVEVSAASDQINTENGTLSDSKDNQLITQLPLNNRATTTSPLGALALSANVQQDSSGNIALSGASGAMVNFSVDGISTANVRQNGALQDAYPSQEGISAIRVTAFNNSAEFSQVGDVTFTTKSGTNQYHGSAFEYLQNSALDANPYGFNGKAPKRFNTFGGSLGGPVHIPRLYNGKDKTFFFADYEGNRRTTAVAQQFLVPTQAERNGDLTALGSPVIPQSNINPTAIALLAYYPLPNVTGKSNYNYENFQSTPARTDGADLRIDQTITAKQSAYARFSRKNITQDYANPLLPNDADSIHNRSLLVSYTYTITSKLVNEFRYGFTNATTSVGFPIEGANALTQLDLSGVDISQHPTTHAFPTFNFSAGNGFTPIGRDKTGVTQSKTMQFTDNVTYTIGKHTLKAGIDARRVRYFDVELFLPSDDFGQFTFQPTFTGTAFGDFLEGTPTTLFFAVSSPDVGGSAWQYGLFAQDEFQLNSRLTLSYGLRWQVLPAMREDGGNLANFDQKNNSIVVPDDLSSYLAQQKIQGSNLAFQQSFNACSLGYTALPCSNYVTASQDHLPQGLRKTYFGNFQPRFSLAYRPFNDTKTVIRAGFGVFTMTNLGPLSFNNSGNPTSNLHTYTNALTAAGTPLIQFPNTAPSIAGIQYGGGGLDQGVSPNYRDPQSNQWNLTVERQLTGNDTLRVSYVGMHSYRLNITEDLNQIPASTSPYQTTATSPYVDPRAPYPNWFTLFSTFNAGKANYEALQVEGTHRMAHDLYFKANYTLAKNLADNQGSTPTAFAGEVNYGIPITDRFHIASDYGNVEGDRRNRFLLTGLYQLPFGDGRAFLNTGGWRNALLGGWELNNVTLLQTGPWLTPNISTSYDQSNTNVVNRGATLRPDVISHDYYKGLSRGQYFNLAAFSPTPVGAGRFGNAGVGILQGPGTAAVALGLAKNYAFTERVKARFECTFTNVLNHTNFAPPATQIDNSTTFGVLSAPQTAENAGNRTGQLALRIDF